MEITKKMGTDDKITRFVLGGLLIVMALTGTIGAWGWLGLIFVTTAFISFCPLYRVVGFKTCQDC